MTTVIQDEELADILAESREYIEINDWAQGEFQRYEYEYDDDGEMLDDPRLIGVCAMGSVLCSQGIEEHCCSSDPRTLAVANALHKAIAGTTETCSADCSCVISWITAWNDQRGRTKQEVLDAFMKAEKIERSGNVA